MPTANKLLVIPTDLTPGSLAEDDTVSSASLCISPQGPRKPPAPLCSSTPLRPAPLEAGGGDGANVVEVATSCNGLDQLDNKRGDANRNHDSGKVVKPNGNLVNVNVVSESTDSIDVLSAGESDAGDTLSRARNNNNKYLNSIASCARDDTTERCRRRGGGGTQRSYLLARELLMTERTYKRDIELVTVSWSSRVKALASSAESKEALHALGRPCLALEPLALAQGAFLARLERCLAAPAPSLAATATTSTTATLDSEEPEFNRIADLLHDYLSSSYDDYVAYASHAGALVARVERARRGGGPGGGAEGACSAFDASAPLPLACLLLRPLHRLLYYAPIAHEVSVTCGGVLARNACEMAAELSGLASDQLRHAENHAALCQLQRDIVGYDKLLVADREFLRLGSLYKHSSKGLQQRMLFLFSDVVVLAWKSGGASGAARFRAQCALALHTLQLAACDLPHTFTLTDDETVVMLSASNGHEYCGWYAALERAIDCAQGRTDAHVDTDLTPLDHDEGGEAAVPSGQCGASGTWCAGGGLAHVCWHRATSLARDHMHLAMQSQLSGYLLRKFKNSHGWQKLWVVFAAFSLYFYKSWQDASALASLPLLGYSVGAPAESDAIHKDFVFKLQFKNHVYFFRADSHYTYARWIETLQTAMTRDEQ